MAASDFDLLKPDLVRIELNRNDELAPANAPIAFVHFPEGGVCSIVADSGADTIEIGLVGVDGFTGTTLLLATDVCPDRTFVQINNATALRIPAAAFLEAVGRSDSLRDALLRYVQVLSVQTTRTAVSNAAHELPQRLARWLLMCHDRVESDELPLTHEFMAMMLGVRRSGVTTTLHLLEGMGGIVGRRGVIGIRDRARLEELAADAYGVPEAEYRRLLGPFGKSPVETRPRLVR
jgi:hypothetical protein